MSTLPVPSVAPVVALERLTVRYGRQAAALDAVSLAVQKGSVYALLGRNGAGKSSAVRCLLGQQKATAGRALLFGGDAWKTRRPAMERTGVVPEEPDAPPEMTPRQLAEFCGRLYRSWDAGAVAARLARFGVPAATPFGRLSKGQKGHVMLALALGHAPDLLVLDDPTLGLDAVARKEFFEELVLHLADRGATVFMTTHDLAGIERIATHAGILKEGKLVLDEELEALKARFRLVRFARGTAVEHALAAFRTVATRAGEWGVEAVVADWDDGAPARLRAGATGGDAAPEVSALSLEEIFTAVVGGER